MANTRRIFHAIWEARKWLVMAPIWVYQRTVRYLLPPSCRFWPGCSEYMMEAVRIHGLIKGFALGVWRILRCNPWGGSGFDPVPGSVEEAALEEFLRQGEDERAKERNGESANARTGDGV